MERGRTGQNAVFRAALAYHEATKHSPASVATDRFVADPAIQPRPYKLYTGPVGRDALSLPRPLARSGVAALAAIGGGSGIQASKALDLPTLGAVLGFSAGVTKVVTHGRRAMAFRAASATGALYHVELYVVCGALDGLDAGVYHVGIHDLALRQLRAGDSRAVLVEAAGGEPAIAQASAVLVCTSTFWRNAWRYRDRAYRHVFWDTGTILANVLALAQAHGLPAEVVAGFVDGEVNCLVDVDGEREAAVALVALGRAQQQPPPCPPVERLGLETIPLAPAEIRYPAIEAMHAASALTSADEVAAWRAARPVLAEPEPGRTTVAQGSKAAGAEFNGTTIPLARQSTSQGAPVSESIEDVIRHRGSARRFAPAPIRFDALSTILACATAPIPADFLAGGRSLAAVYVIANAVDGLASGSYVLDRERGELEQLRAGDVRAETGMLDIGQGRAGQAAVNLYVLSDLDAVLPALGNRGYRAAQLEAAIMGGRAYLAAYALGLGATGLTFFDDEVTAFFSPHAAGKSVMFLVVIGYTATATS